MQQLLRLGALLAAMAWPLQAEDWAKDVTAHFVEPHTREHITEVSTKKNTPTMVVVMTTWCGACSGLRASVNSGAKVRPLLDKFTVAYATEEGADNVWMEAGQNYVPQVYFFNAAGQQLQVFSALEKFKYYFNDEDSLEQGMKRAMELMAAGKLGDPPAATTSAPAAPPLSWEARQQQAKEKVVTGEEPEHKQEDVYDPKHSWDKSIAGHFLENLKPEDTRKKAEEANRPFMIVLTQSWCKACQELVNSVNAGKKTKDLLSAFVNNNAYGVDGLRDWQPAGENYVPQVLFFEVDGTLLDVRSPHGEYKHFFASDEELSAGMAKALDMSKAAGEL